MVNPDGVEYDIATGSYRIVAQEPPAQLGSTYVGTDLNRNWAYQWGCCGGSSGTFSSETYRGAVAVLGARDAAGARLRQLAGDRRRAADQGAIDFHTYSELILWPYGYTTADTAPTADANDRERSRRSASRWRTNGYTPEQATDLYIADGTIDDWMWGRTRSSPTRSRCTRGRAASTRPTELIGRRRRATARRPDAARGVRRLRLRGDRPDLRRRRPERSSSTTSSRARAGHERRHGHGDHRPVGSGDPATTTSGTKQLGTTTSGVNDLVTGAAAALGGRERLDGATSIRSPAMCRGTLALRSILPRPRHRSSDPRARRVTDVDAHAQPGRRRTYRRLASNGSAQAFGQTGDPDRRPSVDASLGRPGRRRQGDGRPVAPGGHRHAAWDGRHCSGPALRRQAVRPTRRSRPLRALARSSASIAERRSGGPRSAGSRKPCGEGRE